MEKSINYSLFTNHSYWQVPSEHPQSSWMSKSPMNTSSLPKALGIIENVFEIPS